jgi:5-methylcytosine-specific restriction endonuclease McrA
MSIHRLVLVLNASYEAINIVPARRAMTLIMKGAALVEKPSAHSIRTARMVIVLPSVIRLVNYRRVPRQNRSVSRKAVMLRDRSTCQYCGRIFQSKELTLDHVVPSSRGGATAWENLVASCKPCNNRKGDRTPVEAGMVLLSKPRQIGIHAKHRLMASESDARVWDQYLFA